QFIGSPLGPVSQGGANPQETKTYDKPDATIALPGEVSDVVVGGNGRYLLLAMNDLQKVGVFDVREGKVLKYLNVDGGMFFVAGGATKFVIVDAIQKTIECWSYTDLERPQRRAVINMTGRKVLLDALM